MSLEAIERVFQHSTAKGTAKLVLLSIANHDGPGGAWPSHARLAHHANVDERTVRRAIRDLVKLGELRVTVQAGGNKSTRPDRRPNLYTITVPDRPQPEREDLSDHPSSERGDASVRNGGTPVSERGDAHAPLTVLEPSVNRPAGGGVVGAAQAAGIRSPEELSEFLAWFKKTGRDIRNAEAVFKSRSAEEQKASVADWRKTELPPYTDGAHADHLDGKHPGNTDRYCRDCVQAARRYAFLNQW